VREHREVAAIVRTPQMQQQIAALGMEPIGNTPAEALMATSNSPTCGHSNSPRQDGRIMGFS